MEFSFLYDTTLGQMTTVSFLLLAWMTENVWYQLCLLFFAAVSICLLYAYNKFTYWKREGIPYIPSSFPLGSLKEVIFQRTSITELFTELYIKAGDNKYAGIYSLGQPLLLIKDVDLIKNILVKDFSNFTDRGMYADPKVDPLAGNLFSLEGQPWKNLRSKISPAFTSGKLKTMYHNIKHIANELIEYTEKLKALENTIDIKDSTARYGLNVISSIALGLEGNNFENDRTDMKRIADMFNAPSMTQVIRMTVNFLCRDMARLLRLRFTSKSVEDFFFQITRDTIKYRKDNNINRNDFLHLLMNLEQNNHPYDRVAENGNTKGKISLSLSEMAAQSFAFVVAGYETTSTTLCFLLLELALKPNVQEKLIDELDSIGPDAEYDELLKLPYLDMVLNETLRKHPPLGVLQRECANNYQLPDGKIIKAGTVCLIPVASMQNNPELFPDPEKFDPERFSKDNIDNIKPYTYIPFGEGPRICIGNRFAYLQMKLALMAILSRYTIALSEKTSLPIKIERQTFLYNSEGGLWLRLIDRTKQ